MDIENETGEGDLSAMIDTGYFEIIPLEVNDAALIADVTRIYLKEDKVIVYDERSLGAYVFHRKDGSYHAKDLITTYVSGDYAHNTKEYVLSGKANVQDNRFERAFTDVLNAIEDEEPNTIVFVLKVKK